MKAVKANVPFENENKQKPFRLFIFYKTACLQRYFHGRILSIRVFFAHGRALWADSASPRTNTIASRDQFKPLRIGENLVANYNG